MSQSSQFTLLSQRRFAPFFWTQFLGAFNDNLFKTALLVALTYDALSWTTISPGLLNNLIPGLFILPYVLFSATAGQIADKVEKGKLARFVKLPPVEAKKFAEIVKFEAKQQIPFPLDEVVWDFQKVAGGEVVDGFAMETGDGVSGQVSWSPFALSLGWKFTNKNPYGTQYYLNDAKLVQTWDWLQKMSAAGYIAPAGMLI